MPSESVDVPHPGAYGGEVIGNSTSRKLWTGCGPVYITVVFDDAMNVKTLFANLRGASSCPKCHLESICRIATMALNAGVPAVDIAWDLRGMT